MQSHLELLRSLYTMAMLVEARDAYTGGHLWRVSRYSYLLADDLGLPQADVARIALGGFLHDLGKVGVPDAVLNKPGPLTDEEYAVIRTHPQVGAELLHGHPLAGIVIDAVLKHHERPDGQGYPLGLSGKGIPLVARIVGIADAFDAMTSTRPYRSGMPVEKALQALRDNLDRQFDFVLGEHFIRLAEAGRFDHVLGHSEPGIHMQRCAHCGPIIALPAQLADGETICCPSCAGEYRLSRQGSEPVLTATGRADPVRARQPRANHELISDLLLGSEDWSQQPRQSLLERLFGGSVVQ